MCLTLEPSHSRPLLQLNRDSLNHPLLDCRQPSTLPNNSHDIEELKQNDAQGNYAFLNVFEPVDAHERRRQLVVRGFFESWKFWSDVRSTVLYDTSPTESVRAAVSAYWETLRESYANQSIAYWVSIHVRIGDRAGDNNVFLANELYFRKAMQRMVELMGTDQLGFLVFAEERDSVKVCEQILNVRPQRSVVRCAGANRQRQFEVMQPVFDLHACAQADGVIQTLGTFGAWCGHHNGNLVVANRDWHRRLNFHRDYYPPNWNFVISGDLAYGKRRSLDEE
jgi:hypothetical protein